MSSPGAPPAWPHGRHWVQLSPWFWANLPSSPLFHFRVPAAPTPSPPSPASRLLCNMADRSNGLCTLLADTVGSPAQSPISCRLLSHFSGHLVPCLPMPRGAGGCEATPAHHATLALLLPAQPQLSLLPAAFMHLSPVAGWTLPHPYLFSSTPSLGASSVLWAVCPRLWPWVPKLQRDGKKPAHNRAPKQCQGQGRHFLLEQRAPRNPGDQ